MNSVLSISDLSHIIQLAVAPVFLLAGVAGFLNVMSGRLGRIVDRTRVIEQRLLGFKNPSSIERASRELAMLKRRSQLTNISIGFCICSGLLVCLLVVTLFIGSYWGLSIGAVVVSFFVLSMLALIVALLMFLKETQLATRTMREACEIVEYEDG